MNERIDREEELSVLEAMRKQELLYLERNAEQTEAVRLVRHDLGNQLQTLSAMMEVKESRETVKLMIGDMKDRLTDVTVQPSAAL